MSTESFLQTGSRPSSLWGMVALATGAAASGMLHQIATLAVQEVPTGWRVEATGSWEGGGSRRPTGLPAADESWLLRDRTLWHSRASLPGRGVRSLSLAVELPPDGLLDVWMSRRSAEAPSSGDVLLRLAQPDATTAKLFVWDHEGPRRVSCSPQLAPASTSVHPLSMEVEDGLLSVRLDGQSSVCAVVGGTHPPAVQSGSHGVRLRELTVDGRPIPAPSPGPLPLWLVLGSVVSLAVAGLEGTTGSGRSTALAGNLMVLATTGFASLVVARTGTADLSTVMLPVAVAATLRLSIHTARALRPLQQGSDWTQSAAVGAAVPAIGLWCLVQMEELSAPVHWVVVSLICSTTALVGGMWSRRRPWRTLAFVAGIVTTTTLLSRTLGDAGLPSIAGGTGLGLALAAVVTGLSRRDHHWGLRSITGALGLMAAVSTLEFMLVRPQTTDMARSPEPSAHVGPAPIPHRGAILLAGPLIRQQGGLPSRVFVPSISASLQRPVVPVGDPVWTAPEVARSLLQSTPSSEAGALVLTAGEVSPLPQHGPANRVFPALTGWLERSILPPSSAATDSLLPALQAILRHMGTSPVVLVTGSGGPDSAPLQAVDRIFAAFAADQPTVHHLDLGRRQEAQPEGRWLDHRGVLTDRGWQEVASILAPTLEAP